MAETKMELADWFDELCARFVINLPQEELESVERICFQVEEAQWFYEDFIRPLDPSLPSLKLKEFCLLIFRHCPILSGFQPWQHVAAYEEFLSYKNRVPVRGAIMLNEQMDQVVLVKGWKKGSRWSFPRGKINKDEPDLECAIREVDEETGFDIQKANLVRDGQHTKYIQLTMREQHMRLYVFRGVPMDTRFEPKTRKEISKIGWWKLSDLPTVTRRGQQVNEEDTAKANQFYMVAPFLGQLKGWIKDQRRRERKKAAQVGNGPMGTEYLTEAEDGARFEEKSHMNRLMDDLRRSQLADVSNNLPEVSISQQVPPDNVAMLKGLLGVGTPAVPPQEMAQPTNVGRPDLMSILMGNQQRQSAVPQNPLQQTALGMPQQVGNMPHPNLRPAPFDNAPNAFPNHNEHQLPPPGPPFLPGQPQMNAGPFGMASHQMPGFQQPPPSNPLPLQTPWFPGSLGLAGGPEVAPGSLREMGDPILHHGRSVGPQASAVPHASKLPAPKALSQQAMGLLNAFKSTAPPPRPPPVTTRQTKSQSGSNLPQVVSSRDNAANKAPRKNHELDIASLLKDDSEPELNPQPVPPAVQIPPAAPKTAPSQQQLLLDLFRRPSIANQAIEKDAGPLSPQPVELSASASPGVTPKAKAFHPRDLANDKTNLFVTPSQVSRTPSNGRPGATVSGPLNAPDFEVIQSHSRRNTGNKNDLRKMTQKPQPQPQAKAAPVSILARPKPNPTDGPSKSPPVPFHSVSPKTKLEAPKPFHPQILKRGQALAASPPPVTIPTGPVHSNGGIAQEPQNGPNALFDRRGSQANEQKSALLSLFGNPSPPQTKPTTEEGLVANLQHIGASNLVSPVSPLPEKILQTPRATPPDYIKSSRISSITTNPGSAAEAMKDNLLRSYDGRPGSSGHGSGSFFSPPKKMSTENSIGYFPAPSSAGRTSRPQSHQQHRSGDHGNTDFLLGYLQNVGKRDG